MPTKARTGLGHTNWYLSQGVSRWTPGTMSGLWAGGAGAGAGQGHRQERWKWSTGQERGGGRGSVRQGHRRGRGGWALHATLQCDCLQQAPAHFRKGWEPKPLPLAELHALSCTASHRQGWYCPALHCTALVCWMRGGGGQGFFRSGGLKGEEGASWPAPPPLSLRTKMLEEGWGGLERERRVWKGWREGLVMRVGGLGRTW